MANTTFNGPVRSENGFEVINVNSTTGAVTNTFDVASTGIVTDKYVKHVGLLLASLLTPRRGIAQPLVSLRSQLTRSALTSRFSALRLPLSEPETLDMRSERQVLERKLSLLRPTRFLMAALQLS